MSTLGQLPDLAQRKFAAIAARCDDMHALMQTAMRQAEAQQRKVTRLRLDQPPLGERAEPEPDDRARFAAMDAAERELDRLRELQAERQRRHASETQVRVRLEDWITRQPPSARFEPCAVRSPLAAGETPQAAVERLRAEVEGVRREMTQVANAPLAADEVRARVRETVAAMASAGRPRIAVERSRVEVSWRRPGAFAPGVRADEVAALLAWLHPALMEDAMLAEVDALGIEGGITTDERARRTAELRDRLRSLERQEESVIEASGAGIARRPDASPLAVLGIRLVGAEQMAA